MQNFFLYDKKKTDVNLQQPKTGIFMYSEIFTCQKCIIKD